MLSRINGETHGVRAYIDPTDLFGSVPVVSHQEPTIVCAQFRRDLRVQGENSFLKHREQAFVLR